MSAAARRDRLPPDPCGRSSHGRLLPRPAVRPTLHTMTTEPDPMLSDTADEREPEAAAPDRETAPHRPCHGCCALPAGSASGWGPLAPVLPLDADHHFPDPGGLPASCVPIRSLPGGCWSIRATAPRSVPGASGASCRAKAKIAAVVAICRPAWCSFLGSGRAGHGAGRDRGHPHSRGHMAGAASGRLMLSSRETARAAYRLPPPAAGGPRL